MRTTGFVGEDKHREKKQNAVEEKADKCRGAVGCGDRGHIICPVFPCGSAGTSSIFLELSISHLQNRSEVPTSQVCGSM